MRSRSINASQALQRLLNPETKVTSYWDSIRSKYFGVLSHGEEFFFGGCDCGAEAIAVALQIKYSELQNVARQLHISLEGINDRDWNRLIERLETTLRLRHKRFKTKSYYIHENVSRDEQLLLLHRIKCRAIVTLEDTTWDNDPLYHPNIAWTHCNVWEPRLERLLDDRGFIAPVKQLDYYRIAHVVECHGLPPII